MRLRCAPFPSGANGVGGDTFQHHVAGRLDDHSVDVLALPPGSEIRILSTRGDWTYAALPNDLRGWIPAKHAEQVRL